MINNAIPKRAGKKASSLTNQKRAIVILLAVCFLLAAALIVTNMVTAMRRFHVEGEDAVYYIIRQKDDEGKTVYVLADKNKNTLKTTDDGHYITASGALVAIDQTTGLGSIYARPVTDGNEQVGVNDRIVIFPVTHRADSQSLQVFNSNGEYSFYRRRIFVDTDKTTYTCLFVDGDYRLVYQKDPSFPDSEYVEALRGADGTYTLRSGNRITVNKRTGVIRSVSYVDFDGRIYFIEKNDNGTYRLVDEKGTELTDRITKKGEKTDGDGNIYVDTLYDYLVTPNGTLVSLDTATGVVGSFGFKEYDAGTEMFTVYHFLRRDGRYVMCDDKGKLITDVSIDDKDFYSTQNNAYVAFNEENGTYKVRIQKDYYLTSNNDGTYYLYYKGTVVPTDSSGYAPLPDGKSFVYFDAASGSYSIMTHDGKDYVEGETKYLNGTDESDIEGSFVIEGFEDTEYDPSLFAALITNGGYTVTPQGGKLSNPQRKPDGSIDFSVYGLEECDRVDATGQTYHHVPAYYILTDLKGNVHKITFGDKIISGTGYYVKYECINVKEGDEAELDRGQGSGEFTMTHQAVYILLDNYSTGFTQTYETFYYYSITDTFLAPIERIIVPKIVPTVSLSTYFDVSDFIISTLNYDKLHDGIMSSDKEDDDKYRDIWVNFSYQDIEERRNSAYSSMPYVMGACELFGYIISPDSVDTCLKAMMDMKCLGVKKLGADYSDLFKYGLDEPEYVISYKLNDSGTRTMLLVSKLTPNDTYYVYTETYNMVVEVSRSALSFLNWTNDMWITDEIYNTPVAFCDKIKLEAGNYWVTLDVEMSQILQTKINPGTSSTFQQDIYISDNRDGHYLMLSASINANTSAPVGNLDIIRVDFNTLRNYYKYVRNGEKTEGLTNEEKTDLAEFINTISDYEYSPLRGTLSTLHNLTVSDSGGHTHLITVMFEFDPSGEIKAYIQVNRESAALVFSLKAYEAYEKIMYSEDIDSAEKQLAYDFYAALGMSPSTKTSFDKITATNSEGVTSVYTSGMIQKTDKDGKLYVDYCLGNDYRVFFNIADNDIIGVAGSWVRYYDMSDDDTTTNGAFTEIVELPYKFEATQVRFVNTSTGNTQNVPGGTLGDGKFTVEITEDRVIVTDDKGTVTRYLRYAGTSVFSNFYATFLWANYEGVCEELTKDQMDALIEGESDFTLTIETKLGPDKKGEYTKYEFKTYRYSERRSYITVNGHGEFFILRNFVDKIIKSSKDIFDNVLIDSSNRY